MKVIEFKTVSPLFEMERDGTKPFTERKIDHKDKRFIYLSVFRFDHLNRKAIVRITNPETGELFMRELVAVNDITHPVWQPDRPKWLILYLGELVTPDK